MNGPRKTARAKAPADDLPADAAPADPAAGFEADDEFEPKGAEAWQSELTEPATGGPADAADAFKSLAAQIVDAFGAKGEEEDAASAAAAAPDEGKPLADPFVGLPPPTPAEEDPADALPADSLPATPREPEPAPAAAVDASEPATPDTAPVVAAAPVETLGAVAPRITIHAFCIAEATMELIKAAARDRRMERAATTVRPGGLQAAVDFYQNQPTPSLIIVEAGDSSEELLRLLGRLAEVCDPGTKVIVIGQANDIALYRELMRHGVSEYLVPPIETLALISAVTTLYADPAQPFVGRQIAFCGAKGGVGASTLAHNVAHCIAERMAAGTVLVDLDLAFGTGGLDFNQDPAQGIVDALAQPDRLDPVLMERMMVKHSDHLSLFAAPASIDQDYDIGPDAYEEVIGKVRRSSPYLVLDLPHQWNRWTRRLLLTSDEVVVVAEPDLACLRNSKNLVDLIRSARPNDPPPRTVLNKVGLPGRPEIAGKDFTEALGAAPDLVIAFDAKAFGEAANNGQMLVEAAAKAKAVEQVGELVRLLTNQRVAAPASAPEKPSLIASLFKRR